MLSTRAEIGIEVDIDRLVFNLPDPIKALRQFVLWRYELSPRGGKPLKVPYYVNGIKRNGTQGSAEDRAQMATFSQAVAAFEEANGKYSGIGLAMFAESKISGVDLDNCLTEGKIDPKRADLLEGTYAEVSPSGHGVRGFYAGVYPDRKDNDAGVEIFCGKGFLTLTGTRLNSNEIIPLPGHVRARFDAIFEGQKTAAIRQDVLQRVKESDPVYQRLRELGHIRKEYDGGRIGITCPFEAEHTRGDGDADAVYFLPHTNGYSTGNFHCLHAHCINRTQSEYFEAIGLGDHDAIPSNSECLSEENKTAALYRGDDGSAGLFVDQFRDKFCFDHAAQRWHFFSGNTWELDRKNKALASISKIIPLYMREAEKQAKLKHRAIAEERDSDGKKHAESEKALLSRIKAMQNAKVKTGILTLAAAGENSLGITGEEWDADPWVLGCPNGVINLKIGKCRPGAPYDYIKTITRAEWQGIDALCPTWDRFISEVFDGDAEVIKYIQTLLGYCLIGDTPLHIFPILWGRGRNGKGTLLETIKYVLDDYAYKAEAEMLLAQKNPKSASGHNSAVIALRGQRVVWTSETDEGRKLSAARVKEYAGGDTLSGRAAYGRDHVEFEPAHQLFLLTNHKPVVSASDYAIWQRIHLIPFELSFVAEPKAANERQVDYDLPEKLKAEASGILAWMVRGCLTYQAEGLVVPEKIKAAVQEYRHEEDAIGLFLDERCVLKEAVQTKAGDLYSAYTEWGKELGQKICGVREFTRDMENRFDHYKRRHKFFIGVTLAT